MNYVKAIFTFCLVFSLCSCDPIDPDYRSAEISAQELLQTFKNQGYVTGLTTLDEQDIERLMADKIYYHCQGLK